MIAGDQFAPEPYIAYLRVSTDKQGISGFGMDAQRTAVSKFIHDQRGALLAEFVEVESGRRHRNRPQLLAALAEARRQKATLIVAKLARLARNLAFIANLLESSVEFIAVDMPHANRLTLQIIAAIAEYDHELISQRTREGMAAAKEWRQRRLAASRWAVKLAGINRESTGGQRLNVPAPLHNDGYDELAHRRRDATHHRRTPEC